MINRHDTFNRIAEALLVDYVRVYYVNAVTDEYVWYSSESGFNALHFEQSGKHFYENMVKDVADVVHPYDRKMFLESMQKEILLPKLRAGTRDDIVYRLVIDGIPMYHSLQLLHGERTEETEYYILGVRNIDGMMRMRQERQLFNHIAVSLARHFDSIYYIDLVTDAYSEFSSSDLKRALDSHLEGDDFFEDMKNDAEKMIHQDDRERVLRFLQKDHLIENLRKADHHSIEYRLMTDGRPVYTRLSGVILEDKRHIVLCIENIDREMRELIAANESARRDSLTGVKNKLAYHEAECNLQNLIDEGSQPEFAIVVCDLNDLKQINDTKGHSFGDNYLKAACRSICDTFTHSPVFRIGGDEFAAILTGRDYSDREELFISLRRKMEDNIKGEDAPVVAAGMSEFDPENDRLVTDPFRRADKLMYDNKRELKRSAASA